MLLALLLGTGDRTHVSVEQNAANPHGGRKYAKGLTMKSQSKWLPCTLFTQAICLTAGFRNLVTPAVMKDLVAAMERANMSSANYTNCGVLVDYTPKHAVMSVPLDATAYAGRGTVGAAFILVSYVYITDTAMVPLGHRISRMDLLHRLIPGQRHSRPGS